MLAKGINSPITSSAGRLFDAIASIIGITDYASYEGKAAMMLEFAIKDVKTKDAYPFNIVKTNIEIPHAFGLASSFAGIGYKYIVDWEPMVKEILKEIKRKQSPFSRIKQKDNNTIKGDSTLTRKIAAKFHNTLAEMILAIAKKVGEKKVVLSGGCFQNKYLIEKTINLLQKKGFQVYWHQRVPTNDGGISLGQIRYMSLYT